MYVSWMLIITFNPLLGLVGLATFTYAFFSIGSSWGIFLLFTYRGELLLGTSFVMALLFLFTQFTVWRVFEDTIFYLL